MVSKKIKFALMLISFGFLVSHLFALDSKSTVFVEPCKAANLSESEALWIPSKIDEALKKNVPSVLNLKVAKSDSSADCFLRSFVKKDDELFYLSLEFVDGKTSESVASASSKGFSNAVYIFMKNGQVESLLSSMKPQIFASNSSASNGKNPNGPMISNKVRGLNHELAVGAGYDFFLENTVLETEKDFSFMHAITMDLGYALFPHDESLFGFAVNIGASFPFGIISPEQYLDLTIDYRSSYLLGYGIKNSVGCDFRYDFDGSSRLDIFLGAAFDYYYLEYDTGIETIERKSIQNMIFGLQTRASYAYSFNDLIALRLGAIFDYDFYSLARALHPEQYSSNYAFVITPFIQALIKF